MSAQLLKEVMFATVARWPDLERDLGYDRLCKILPLVCEYLGLLGGYAASTKVKETDDVCTLSSCGCEVSTCPGDDEPEWITGDPVLPDLGWLGKAGCKKSGGVSKGNPEG